MNDREEIVAILDQQRRFPLRYDSTTGDVTRFEGDRRLSTENIDQINQMLIDMGQPFEVDPEHKLVRKSDSSAHMADTTSSSLNNGLFVHLDIDTGLTTHFADRSLLNESQISEFNTLQFYQMKLGADSRQIKSGISSVDDKWEDKLNIDTVGRSYHLLDSKFNDTIHYTPIPYKSLILAFKKLSLTTADVLVDLGCGKGRIVCFAATQRLKKVIGVELDEALLTTARENAEKMKGRRCDSVELVCEDIALYSIPDATVYVSYGPFGVETVKAVLNNIHASIEADPRKVSISFLMASDEVESLLRETQWLSVKTENPMIFCSS